VWWLVCFYSFFCIFSISFSIPVLFEFESETSLQKIGAGIGSVVFAYCTGLFAYYWYQLFKSVKGFFTLLSLNKNKRNELIALHTSSKEWLLTNLS
jgi:hypothetical protein